MNFKKLIFILFCFVVIFAVIWSCAGPKEAVKVEKPVEKKVEPEKEIAKVEVPKVELKPMEWTTAVNDAEVTMGGKAVSVPKEYSKYALMLRSLEKNKVELFVEEKGMAPTLLLRGTSTLKPDREGRIAFQVTEINEERIQPLFDVLGLRVLRREELRDNYYLFGSFEEKGVSVLEAYDMGNSVTMKFFRK